MAEDENSKYLMMYGSGGNPDYLLFATNFGAGLGVKPVAIFDGSNLKKPGYTVFAARVRSSGSGFSLPSKTNVTMLPNKDKPFSAAWPNIPWDNEDKTRSSAMILSLIKGSLMGSLAELNEFRKNTENKALATKMADYLITLADADKLVLSREDMIEWIDTFYAPTFKKVVADAEQQNAVAAELEEHVGVFKMQSDLLKKAFSKTTAGQAKKAANGGPAPHEMDVPDKDD